MCLLAKERHSNYSDQDYTTGKHADPILSSQNKPKTIQNGHYHASNSSRTINDHRLSNSDLHQRTNHAPRGSQQSLRGQPYDRYLTSQLQLQINTDRTDSRTNIAQSRQSLTNDNNRGSASRLTNGGSQALNNQEDTFGIFTSDEDPKLYQRR